MTPEEIDAAEQQFRKSLAEMMIARAAIVADAGPYKRGEGKAGQLPCPVCDGGILRYSRAGLNGHIHASCTTKGCVRWME